MVAKDGCLSLLRCDFCRTFAAVSNIYSFRLVIIDCYCGLSVKIARFYAHF